MNLFILAVSPRQYAKLSQEAAYYSPLLPPPSPPNSHHPSATHTVSFLKGHFLKCSRQGSSIVGKLGFIGQQ